MEPNHSLSSVFPLRAKRFARKRQKISLAPLAPFCYLPSMQILSCPICKSSFGTSKPQRIYCSLSCRRKAARQREVAIARTQRRMRFVVAGRTFTTGQGSPEESLAAAVMLMRNGQFIGPCSIWNGPANWTPPDDFELKKTTDDHWILQHKEEGK